MKVALAQINTTVGDVWGNVEKAAEALERAVEGGAGLVVFPELAITGYPPEDLLLRPSFIEENLDALGEFAGKVPDGVTALIGFVDLDGALLGMSVCEDIWYPGGPAREQALGGAGVLLNVSASPYHRLKGASRERMLSVRASDYGCYVAFCNLVGGQDELVFDGRSAVFDPGGNVIARAKQFEEDLLLVDLHPEEALFHRLHDPRPRT